MSHARRNQVVGLSALACIGVAIVWTWLAITGADANASSGVTLLCTDPACGDQFTLSRDELQSWPRGEQGQGLKCDGCGKFTARVAAKCERCGAWYPAVDERGDNSGCPKCNPNPTTSSASQPARTGF